MLYTKRALYSIYYLIIVFIMATVFLFFLGFELLAILYVLLYLGAIVVLYIISIYTLGSSLIDDFEKSGDFKFNWFLGPCFYFFILFFYDQHSISIYLDNIDLHSFMPDYFDMLYQDKKSTDVLTFVLFDYYPIALLLGSLILIMAMIGAIILTLHYVDKKNINKNDVF